MNADAVFQSNEIIDNNDHENNKRSPISRKISKTGEIPFEDVCQPNEIIDNEDKENNDRDSNNDNNNEEKNDETKEILKEKSKMEDVPLEEVRKSSEIIDNNDKAEIKNFEQKQVQSINYEMNDDNIGRENNGYEGAISEDEATFDEKEEKWMNLKIESDDVEILGIPCKKYGNDNGKAKNNGFKKERKKKIIIKKRKPFNMTKFEIYHFFTEIINGKNDKTKRLINIHEEEEKKFKEIGRAHV